MRTKSMALTSQKYWQLGWESHQPVRGFEYFDDIAKHLPKTPGLSFLEIGCAPGRILAEFCARLDYVAYGVDYACDSQNIEDYLRSQKVKMGQVFQQDFLAWRSDQIYDIVTSFGFIEHFEDPVPIIDRHFDLVRPGGFVVITMPNFAGGQKLLHWLFDRDVLKLHNTKCMSLPFLRDVAKRNQARLVAAHYAGGHFDFWFGKEQKRSWLTTRLMWRTINLLKRIRNALPNGVNPWFSPYLISIYQAKSPIDLNHDSGER